MMMRNNTKKVRVFTMSITKFNSPEQVAAFLAKFGQKLAPEFVRFYAGQKLQLPESTRMARALDLAIYHASDQTINLKSLGIDASLSSFFNPTVGTGGGGTTEDPATAIPVSQALAPGQAPDTRPYKALNIASASPEAIAEHANQLHTDLQGAADDLRFNKLTPDRINAMASKVKNAQHFYDSVSQRAEASGEIAEVQALFSHRFRRLASDLPAYQNQVDMAQISLDRKLESSPILR